MPLDAEGHVDAAEGEAEPGADRRDRRDLSLSRVASVEGASAPKLSQGTGTPTHCVVGFTCRASAGAVAPPANSGTICVLDCQFAEPTAKP